MGAMITAVAALLTMSERVMVTIKRIVSTRTGETPPPNPSRKSVTSSVAPDVSSAPPIGIIAPSKTITGQLMLS